jgi:hypothetical protein
MREPCWYARSSASTIKLPPPLPQPRDFGPAPFPVTGAIRGRPGAGPQPHVSHLVPIWAHLRHRLLGPPTQKKLRRRARWDPLRLSVVHQRESTFRWETVLIKRSPRLSGDKTLTMSLAIARSRRTSLASRAQFSWLYSLARMSQRRPCTFRYTRHRSLADRTYSPVRRGSSVECSRHCKNLKPQ